jgi:hypothetical protein
MLALQNSKAKNLMQIPVGTRPFGSWGYIHAVENDESAALESSGDRCAYWITLSLHVEVEDSHRNRSGYCSGARYFGKRLITACTPHVHAVGVCDNLTPLNIADIADRWVSHFKASMSTGRLRYLTLDGLSGKGPRLRHGTDRKLFDMNSFRRQVLSLDPV